MYILAIAPTILPSLSNLSREEIALLLQANFHKNELTLTTYQTGNSSSYYTNLSDPGLEARSLAIARHVSSNVIQTMFGNIPLSIENITLNFFQNGIVVISAKLGIKDSVDSNELLEKLDSRFDPFIKELFFNEAKKISSLFEAVDSNNIRFAWVHRVYLKLSLSDKAIERYISKTTLKSFENNDCSSHFGWGDSVINLEKFKHHEDLYDGCIFSQYFYFSLHQFNKFVPDVIAQLNTNYRLGKLTKIRKEGVHLKQRIFELEIQYADYLHSVAGEMRNPASQFDKNWRIPELRANLMRKIPVLQDLLQDVENRSSRRSDIFIESVLFFVSILSLVGLFLGAHDYLTKSANQHKPSLEVLSGMVPTNPSDILSLAIGLSVIAFTIFLLLKLLSRNK